MEFTVIQGDIAGERADALVNAAGTSLRMGSGVAGALRRGANGPINDEAMSKGPIELGTVAVTDAYDLDADYVIHAAAIFDSERIPPSSACGRLLEGLRPSLFTGGVKRVTFTPLSPYLFRPESYSRVTHTVGCKYVEIFATPGGEFFRDVTADSIKRRNQSGNQLGSSPPTRTTWCLHYPYPCNTGWGDGTTQSNPYGS